LSGVVVTSDATPQPVRRAIVTLGGNATNGQSAITDDQGRFAFAGLPAGHFTLTASKAAHITTAYGARGPGRPGTTIALGAGQSIDNLTLLLPHGASVSGVVRDRTGEPAATVQVVVIRIDGSRPAADPAASPDCLTDDRGVFRAYGLGPGTYIVAALPRLPGLNGGMSVMSVDDVDAAFREQRLRAGRSANGLSAASSAQAAASVPAPKPPVVYGYVPIYHPGTPVNTDATRLTLRAGEDLNGIDITLDLATLSTIQGTVVNPGGPLPELTLTMSADGPAVAAPFGTVPSLTGDGGGRPGVNGNDTFKYINVAPGHYTIVAQTSYTRTTVTAGGFSTARVDPGTVPMLWASTKVDVTGNDLAGLTLQLQPAMTIAGRVAFSATSLAPPQSLASIRVTLLPVDSGSFGVYTTAVNGVPSGPVRLPSPTATVRGDGTFEVLGVLPGRYNVTAAVSGAGGPNGWWLQSALANGRDLLDAPFDIGAGGSVAAAVLTLTDQHTEISGVLQAGAAHPAPDYFVIVFASDPAIRPAGSRRVKATRPASDGHFSFVDLPAGEYILAALTDVVGDEWQVPTFLEQVERSGAGVKVTLGDGEKKTQNLQISGR
jgi:hypothetical protein